MRRTFDVHGKRIVPRMNEKRREKIDFECEMDESECTSLSKNHSR